MQLADTTEKRLPKCLERSKMFSKASEVDNFNDSYPSYGKSRLRCACWAICLFPLILHAGEPNVDESAFVAKQILVCFEPEVSDEGIESI